MALDHAHALAELFAVFSAALVLTGAIVWCGAALQRR
jgi:hypothetical protein